MTLQRIAEGVPPHTLAELEALEIVRGRPLIAVDVDDCLAVYVEHLGRYMQGIGYELRLYRYELEGSMYPVGSEEPLPFDDCLEIIYGFFREECERQELMPGAADALHSLAADAQIVILTNVPQLGAEARRRNLTGHGLHWPIVVNSGGKGRAMAWLAAAAGAPAAFVDDSERQIQSVARHAPEVVRVHFAGAESIRRLFPDCADATAQVRDWTEAERVLRATLGLAAR